jgi:hypothetical protein
MTMAVTTPSILPVPAPAGGNQVAVVEIPDDDIPPPGWDQWVSQPAPAPELPVGVLAMREDGCVMSGCPAHIAEASSSHATLPTSDGAAARLEQEEERVDASPAHFSKAQAEQALWEELRGHGASLNRALNEALQIHSGPVWRVFQLRDCSLSLAVLPLSLLPRPCFPRSAPLGLYPPAAEIGGSGRGEVRYPQPDEL